VLTGAPQRGATVADGLASVKAMAAIAESARTGRAVSVAEMKGAI
jgi:predicted dehydrogenase